MFARASATTATPMLLSRSVIALLLVLAAASSFSPVALAKRGALRYEEGDNVVMYANKVGPFKNPR